MGDVVVVRGGQAMLPLSRPATIALRRDMDVGIGVGLAIRAQHGEMKLLVVRQEERLAQLDQIRSAVAQQRADPASVASRS